jgi:hypothetical protein
MSTDELPTDQQRLQAERVREQAEDGRQDAEQGREITEERRSLAESDRKDAEQFWSTVLGSADASPDGRGRGPFPSAAWHSHLDSVSH